MDILSNYFQNLLRYIRTAALDWVVFYYLYFPHPIYFQIFFCPIFPPLNYYPTYSLCIFIIVILMFLLTLDFTKSGSTIDIPNYGSDLQVWNQDESRSIAGIYPYSKRVAKCEELTMANIRHLTKFNSGLWMKPERLSLLYPFHRGMSSVV